MGRLAFHPFDPHKATCVYRTHMPHWRQDGATYFVTFRLRDAMPKRLLESWKLELASWLSAHGIDLNEDDWHSQLKALPDDVQRIYSQLAGSRLDKYLDQGAGSCFLRNNKAATMVADALHYFNGARLDCGDFVIMPNHVHWIVTPCLGQSLEGLLHSVKSYTALRVNATLGRDGGLWQKGNYDHIVRDTAELRHFRSYISRNPQTARLPSGQTIHYETDWDIP